MNDQPKGLYKLSELKKFEVADSDADARGWDVYSGDNKNIGKVIDMVVDTDLMKVKFLEVEINSAITSSDGSRYMVLPVSYAHLDPKKKSVFVSGIETRTTLIVPKFE